MKNSGDACTAVFVQSPGVARTPPSPSEIALEPWTG